MQKNDVFFKDFKISFIVAGLAFTVFFAVAIFCELLWMQYLKLSHHKPEFLCLLGFLWRLEWFFSFSPRIAQAIKLAVS